MVEPTEQPTSDSGNRPRTRIHVANLGREGAVIRGEEISQVEAERIRKTGGDVVVCGADHEANRRLARTIERNANGVVRACHPHKNEGKHALPHFQPLIRPPEGHSFYETPKLKAKAR